MRLLLTAFAVALSLPAAALTVDEVVELSEAGVSDEIIINQMQADGSFFELTARQIVDLQKKKVSPAVINSMVQLRGKPAPKTPAGDPKPIPRAEPEREEAKDTVLTVRNVSKSKISVLAFPGAREVALVKGEIASASVLVNGARVDLSLPSGIYRVRWAAEDEAREMVVAKDLTNEVEVRDDGRTLRGLRFAVLIDGQEQPAPGDPVVTPPPSSEDTGPRVYQSPTNSHVTVIRDIVQAPTRTVIVPGTSSYAATYDPDYAATWGYTGGTSYYADPSCGSTVYYASSPRWSVGFRYGSSCSPRTYYGHRIYSHGGHSSHHGHHHYSRTADNVQYYLRWPFGHRHR
jgi:hypothetical protein